MSPEAAAVLGSWRLAPPGTTLLVATALLYVRGWRALASLRATRLPRWRLAAFLGGCTVLWLAVASPLDAFAGLLLRAHMAQHFLLTLVAPPLLLLGAPALPLLRGLPTVIARDALGPFLRWPLLARAGRALAHPATGWLALAVAMWAWHVPALYERALASPAWHAAEHATLVGAALVFWWPVVQPWPSRRRLARGVVPLYLLAAELQNTAFAAVLTFAERPLYATYVAAPRVLGGSALEDQVTAGLLMWIPGSLVLVVPAVALTARALRPATLAARPGAPRPVAAVRAALRASPRTPAPLDLLALPGVGPALRSLPLRRAAQVLMLLAVLAVAADGLLGHQMGAMNLAGVVPWTYGRALVVVGLLIAGNVFCAVCPFALPRALARRLGAAGRPWPRALRSKWLAVAALTAFFWLYETAALWDRPAATAAILLGYLGLATAVDAVFAGASFCKWLCPLGQFHFAHALASPLEVTVRSPDACARCTTHDCLRGNAAARGCELELFVPHKAGNLDCTFCLDCVRACPHDNVGLLAGAPGRALWRDAARPAAQRLARRNDVVALALVLVFAAFANAAAMVAPVADAAARAAARLGTVSAATVTGVALLVAMLAAPPALVGGAAALGRRWAGAAARTTGRELFGALALALLPLGLTMWAAHFVFHLLAGWRSGWPAAAQALAAAGWPVLGEPDWVAGGAGFAPDALLPLEVLLLDAGLLLTLYAGWRSARARTPARHTALALVAPWAVVAAALWAGGVWTLAQPMAMRGMVH